VLKMNRMPRRSDWEVSSGRETIDAKLVVESSVIVLQSLTKLTESLEESISTMMVEMQQSSAIPGSSF